MLMQDMTFIGRQKEIKFLTNWVVNKNGRPIVYIHDAFEEAEYKGGIGKTWLLREFHTLMEHHTHVVPLSIIDFFNVLDRDSFVIAERFVQAVKTTFPNWSSENVSRLLQAYREAAQGQKAGLGTLREQLAHALVTDFHMLHQQLVDTDTYLLLFFDTFEVIEYNPITAVLWPSQTFPDLYHSNRIRAIIAGRNAINWSHQNWIGRENEVVVHALPPFDLQETEQYLQTRLDIFDYDSLSPEQVKTLHEKTRGRPILLGLVTDVLDKRLKTPEKLVAIDREKFEASLVEEINNFPDTSKWVILSMAHIYHHFDAAFLKYLMKWPGWEERVSYPQYQEMAEELPKLSFVRSAGSGGNFVLHDEMRRLVNYYCWEKQDADKRIRRELSALAVEYYSTLINQEKNEEKRQSYIVEQLYHELFLDIEAGFQSFTRHFTDAIDFSLRAFARNLLQELRKFESQLSQAQHASMKFAEARELREEEKPEAALDILTSLEQDTEWAKQHCFALMLEQGTCYLQLNQYPQAIQCYEECKQIAIENKDITNHALLLNRLGYIHRLQGYYADAMRYYEEALNVQRHLDDPIEYANLLNNMSNVLRFQGKLEDALRYCKLSLSIRRELVKQHKLNEFAVGLSLSMKGHIYHTLGEVSEEEKAYQEAFDIYNRVGNRSAIASTYNFLGRIWMRKGNLERAHEDFEHAARIAAGVNRDAQIENYNQQGRLAFMQEQWQTAQAFFEQAVALSRQVSVKFQLAENLLYLADTLDQLGLSSLEQIKEAKRIARQNNYAFLLARAAEVQGDMHWRKQEYQSAFNHYREACRHMAPRGFPEFNRILRKLNDLLLEVPANYLPGAIDALLSYWLELGLNQAYPQFPAICKEVSKHMLL